MRIGRLPRPSIARPPAAAGKQFAFKPRVSYLRVPDLYIGSNCFCTRALFQIAANFHRRTANGRPYNAIQDASAKTTTSDIIGRAPANTTRMI